MIYDSILDTIGNTPVVRLNRIAPPRVEMFVRSRRSIRVAR
jgi:cysteine synthase A